MESNEMTRSAASRAVAAMRKSMGKTQQTFAVEVLKTAISTIARWETSDPPKGEALLRLSEIAGEHRMIEYRDEFRELYIAEVFEKLHASKSFLLMAPPHDKRPARGYLLVKLEGNDELCGAQGFLNAIDAARSTRGDIKENAIKALRSLPRDPLDNAMRNAATSPKTKHRGDPKC